MIHSNQHHQWSQPLELPPYQKAAFTSLPLPMQKTEIIKNHLPYNILILFCFTLCSSPQTEILPKKTDSGYHSVIGFVSFFHVTKIARKNRGSSNQMKFLLGQSQIQSTV